MEKKTTNERHQRIKMQSAYLHFKHPNILSASDGAYHQQDVKDEKIQMRKFI